MTNALNKKTPQGMWAGKVPATYCLKMFGTSGHQDIIGYYQKVQWDDQRGKK